MNKQVIILGAGIAGLSLAIQLAGKGTDCVVLEEKQNFDGPTSGVRISAEGVRILKSMGIDNIGYDTNRVIMHYGSLKIDFDVSNDQEFSSAIMVTRRAVYEKLLSKTKALSIQILNGFKAIDAVEREDSVEVTSDTGRIISGKLLIGADGVGSIVRRILNPDLLSAKRYAGYLGVGMIVPGDLEIEMSMYHFPGSQIGLASIGKKCADDSSKNLFLWTHLYMTEEKARSISAEMVKTELQKQSEKWDHALRSILSIGLSDRKSVLAYGPVFNGNIPSVWFSKNMIIIGDAAHPYGPGGQGISMALKDAQALSELIVNHNLNPMTKASFQKTRYDEARKSGVNAELRNDPKKQLGTTFSIFLAGTIHKIYHLLLGGKLKSF